MPRVIREIPLAPEPFAIARALSDRPGLAVLASDLRGALRPGDARSSFITCDPVATTHDLVPPRDAAGGLGWGGLPPVPRWIGAIPYDAVRASERAPWRGEDRRPAATSDVPVWRRYASVVRVDHATGRVAIEADDASAAEDLWRALRRAKKHEGPRHFALEPLDAPEPESAHVARVRAALDLILRGEIYQVNLARLLAFRFRGDALELFASLFKRAPTPYGFFVDLGDTCVCASSPELALELTGEWLRTAPIKGTRPRGRDAGADAALALELDRDPKERAELTMTTDLHRNDFGRVASVGSVRVLGPPRVLAGRTVWSRVAEVVARRAAGVSDEAIVRALLPCGSVTGAPKVRAMEIIATLEPFRRGMYTGAFGYADGAGSLTLAVAIRTLELSAGHASYFAGGGIVSGSMPERELEETKWKASQLAELRSG